MGFNLFFDIAGLTVLLFLLFSIALKKQIIGTSNKIYLGVIIVTTISAVLDILASIDTFPISLLFNLNTFFVLFRALTALSLFFYACNLGKIYARIKKRKWLYILIFIPILVLLVLLIVNHFNHMLFDYLEGPLYKRGDFMWVAYAVGYFYLSGSLVVIIISRKYYLTAQVIAMFAAFLFQVGAQIFQFFVGSVLIEMFVTAITLLTLSLFIESPENFIDFKTNNLNYHSFLADAQQKLDIKTPFSIAFIKVTNASSVYNLYGYKDAINFNRACSAALWEKSKKIDRGSLVYFLGNSTFAYMYTKREADEEVLALIHDYFSKPLKQNGISFQFVAKTCLVNCPEDCDNTADLVAFSNTFYELTDANHLDIKPYRQEKGNVLFELDHILERAISKKSFSIYYQGIYSIKDQKFVAAEALIRLKDPDYGLIMPALMIPYAESRGKIIAIGKIVLEKSFQFFANNLRGKLDYIEINLSPSQLMDPNLISDITKIANHFDIKPNEVVFEVTENTAIMEEPTIEKNIKEIRELGYKIAIDDFGTGYSNLSRILQLDISILKFDKTMTDLLIDKEQDDFFNGLLPIFRNRHIKLLFEGVETKETADKLKAMKVDHIQGFYYSKTIPEDDFLKLINQ